MKRFYLSLLACVLCVSAWAHRDVYFSWSFAMSENLGHNSWSYEGADYMDGVAEAMLISNGFYTNDAGDNTIMIMHDQRSHGERTMTNISEIHLRVITGTGENLAAHIKPVVELEDENGDVVKFTFDPLVDDTELEQDVVSTGCEGDPSALGQINFFRIYFDGVLEGEVVAPYYVALCSGWTTPQVGPNHIAKTLDYSNNKAGDYYEEPGYTYIQAEDFDEKWINGRIAHSSLSGSNGYRLNEEDKNLRIDHTDDGGLAGRYAYEHGRIISNHVTAGAPTGLVINDYCPSGADWQSYYGDYADGNGGITLDNAIRNWGAWTEYTFESTQDQEIGISLRISAHRSTFEPTIGNGSNKWYEKVSEHGYYLVDEPDTEYFEKYGFKYRVAVDDVIQPINFDKLPAYAKGTNGATYATEIVPNPDKWTAVPTKETQFATDNTYFLHFPYPFWGWEKGGSFNPDNVAAGWQPFYVSDMLKEAFERGLCTETAYNSYNRPDYKVKVSKGKHTIKVQNCGGISLLDELRLQSFATGGVEEVIVDGDQEGLLMGVPEYYDLNGRKVVNPSNGIFIKKTGTKVEKVVVK